MNRRYRTDREAGEPIDVVADGAGDPAVFRWRGRRYTVHVVVMSWVEALPWWVDRGCGQRTVWRVEAVSRAGMCGVYDLYRVSDNWGLERVID